MRVSVIIPTYYRPEDLSELFNSLLKQTAKPLEIIVVDDSPIPLIKHICEKYQARFDEVNILLAYIKNPGKRSITIARNFGAKMAKGEIVVFLDSDVVLFSDYLDKISEVFVNRPEALGVGGWTVFPPFPKINIGYYAGLFLAKLFRLHHHSRNSCIYPEYPVVLTKTINCNWLSGATMAWRRNIFDELEFDENLKGYAYMEDVLFSRLVSQKHPNSLFITPHAKCIHKVSQKGRTEGLKLRSRRYQNRKYVQIKLYGSKGVFLYGWQILGLLIFRLLGKIRKWEVAVDEPSPYPSTLSAIKT